MPVTFEAPLALYLPLTGGTLSGAVTFSSAITYGGVTFTNAVTGTGRPVLQTSPAFITPDIGAATGTSLNLLGGLTVGGGTFLTTSGNLTNGAAANLATMTNGPTPGNPTKWAPVLDNGTYRWVPMW